MLAIEVERIILEVTVITVHSNEVLMSSNSLLQLHWVSQQGLWITVALPWVALLEANNLYSSLVYFLKVFFIVLTHGHIVKSVIETCATGT